MLTKDDVARYREDGYLFPIRVMTADKAAAYRAALERHESQFETTMRIGDDDHDDVQRAEFRKRVTDRLAESGARVGVEHAELFKLISRL